MAIALLLLNVLLDMAIDHIITHPMIYLALLYLQDLRKYYRLKSVSFLCHPQKAGLPRVTLEDPITIRAIFSGFYFHGF